MIQFFKMIALILGIGQSSHQEKPQVFYHVHPTTYHVNGKQVVTHIKTINSLSKEEFVDYYFKSKNIICL